MNLTNLFNNDTKIETISKFLSLIFKLSTLIGALCFALYCHKLNYFPTGITTGDSLLFILFAISFGIIYGFFVISLLSLGLWITYLLVRPILWISIIIYKKFSNNPPRQTIKFIKPDFIHAVFALLGVLFIFVLASLDKMVLMSLPLIAILLSFLWATYKQKESDFYSLVEANEVNNIETEEKQKNLLQKKNNIYNIKYMVFAFIIFIPLFMGGISEMMVEAGMKFSNAKKGTSYVLIQPPYDSFIPPEYIITDSPYNASGYKTFKEMTVMLTGIGTKTIIQLPAEAGKKPQTLEIPNEKIIIIPIVN